MKQDSNAIWQEMMNNWQVNQQSIVQQMMDNMQYWRSNFDASSAPDLMANASTPVLEAYKAFFDAFSKQVPTDSAAFFAKSTMPHSWVSICSKCQSGENEPNSEPVITIRAASISAIAENYSQLFSEDESHRYFLKTLSEMSNPKTGLNIQQ